MYESAPRIRDFAEMGKPNSSFKFLIVGFLALIQMGNLEPIFPKSPVFLYV
jgi:hypothetical protein